MINNKKIINILIACHILVILLLNCIRLFDGNFWGDEAYSILLAKESFSQIIKSTAMDVHPPLYYIILKIMCSFLGYNSVTYHFTSFLPYVLLILLGVTVIRKRYGLEVSFIFISCATWLRSSSIYNVEVRMYSWGALFVIISFLALHRILIDARKKDWVCFTIFSLAASYTHYYCLISVAFFYLAIILYVIFRKRQYLVKTICTCLITVLAYLPWLRVLLETFNRTTDNFWQTEIPTFKDCIFYMFDCKFDRLLSIIFLLLVLAVLFKKAEPDMDAPKNIIYNGNDLLLAGFFAIFGTILVGIIVSHIVKPVFLTRYLYPVTVVAWLLLGVCVSKCKYRTVMTLAISTILLAYGVPHYWSVINYECMSDKALDRTLELTQSEIDEQDVIYSDISHIVWTISELYYPETERYDLNWEELPEFEKDLEYWLILNEAINQEKIKKLESANACPENVIEKGCLGTLDVWIYRVHAE